MLEYHDRLKHGIIGCPMTKIDTATNFITRLKEKAEGNRHLTKWVGELYLELHRGTYTSIGKNKRFNRKGEYLLRNIEWLSLLSGSYDREEIYNNWEILLTNQFHDIIPGSSIKEVYDESDESYGRMFESANRLLDSNVCDIKNNIDTDGGVVVFNSNSFENSDDVLVGDRYIYAENIPPMGYKVVVNSESTDVKVYDNTLENSKIKVIFDDKMEISSIYDKENQREVLKGNGNRLVVYEDIPKEWDAWEISDYYRDKFWNVDNVISVEPLDMGTRKGIRIKRSFNNSVIVQDVMLGTKSARLDFDTYIDWKESRVLLKAHFPVEVHANKATYDIQYGTVERPNHYNTSWDAAKFEVCAHKFCDISQPDYGVSLMSDCKYGYSILGNDMSVTLLKCALYPNPEADKCEHRFTYSLYVHGGDHRIGGSSREGYRINNPMLGYEIGKQSGTMPCEYSFVSVNKSNIFIESVKKAEDDEGIIVRLYDAFGVCSTPTISLGFDAGEAYITDMNEAIQETVSLDGRNLTVAVKPFEIVTLKITK